MYSTAYDVRLALTPGASATDLETAAHLTNSQIEDAINEADGVINTYISQWYTVVLATVENPEPVPDPIPDPPPPAEVQVAPAPVRAWSRDIAAYLATLTFFKNKEVTEDDPVRQRYLMVLGMLRDIRDRKSILDPDVFPPNPDTANGQGVTVVNTYEGKLFGPEDFGLAPEGASNPQILWPYRIP